MEELPKLYDDKTKTRIESVIVRQNGKQDVEIYDLEMTSKKLGINKKIVYHKHIEGICKTKHQGTSRCQGIITRYTVSPSAVSSDRWDLTTWCTNGHQNFSSPMKYDGKSYEEQYGNPVGNICNKNLGSYEYYEYSCGYEEE